jgi:hypothetical protein
MCKRLWRVTSSFAVTASLRVLYVFVVIEHDSRPVARVDVTAHSSAQWILQQLREVIGYEDTHRYLIHDRDSIFARRLDESIRAWAWACLNRHRIARRPIRSVNA